MSSLSSYIRLSIQVICIGVFVISCSGRTSSSKALKESIEAFKDKHTISQSYYIPEQFSEVKTDTTLQNGFSVKLHTFTDMANTVNVRHTKDHIEYITHFREFESQVIVSFKDETIFNKRITKRFIEDHFSNSSINLDHFILKGIWADGYHAFSANSIVVDIQYCSVYTSDCQTYNLTIYSDGSFNLNTKKPYTL